MTGMLQKQGEMLASILGKSYSKTEGALDDAGEAE